MKTIEKLRKEADKLFYLYVMQLHNNCCEICGEQAVTAHHFILKSQSAELRYNPENGISICNRCHCKIHIQADMETINRIITIRGQEWADNLYKIKNQVFKKYRGINYYKDIIKQLKEPAN